ncbi:MAG: hypothetical protein K2Q12_00005, partial [Rickettsiales bacterium]|nr:hypothetical protein [Rickettsiales bacterium]
AHLEWRQVVDPFGDKGWVKKSLLSPRRTALTTTKNVALRVHPSGSSATLANVEEGVVCIIKECSLQWCQVDAGNYRGWIQRQALWGIEPREVIK